MRGAQGRRVVARRAAGRERERARTLAVQRAAGTRGNGQLLQLRCPRPGLLPAGGADDASASLSQPEEGIAAVPSRGAGGLHNGAACPCAPGARFAPIRLAPGRAEGMRPHSRELQRGRAARRARRGGRGEERGQACGAARRACRRVWATGACTMHQTGGLRCMHPIADPHRGVPCGQVSPANISSLMESEDAEEAADAERERRRERGYQEEAASSAHDRSGPAHVRAGSALRRAADGVRQRQGGGSGAGAGGSYKNAGGEAAKPLPLPEKTLGEALLEQERERERRERERTPLKLHLHYGDNETAAPGEAILEESAWGPGKDLKSGRHSTARQLHTAAEPPSAPTLPSTPAQSGALADWSAAPRAAAPLSPTTPAFSIDTSDLRTGAATRAVAAGLGGGGGRGGTADGWDASNAALLRPDAAGSRVKEKDGAHAHGADTCAVGASSPPEQPLEAPVLPAYAARHAQAMSDARMPRPSDLHSVEKAGGILGGDGSGAAGPLKDEEPVGGRTEEEVADDEGSHEGSAYGRAAPSHTPTWARRQRETTTLHVPSDAYPSITAALAVAISGDVIEVGPRLHYRLLTLCPAAC